MESDKEDGTGDEGDVVHQKQEETTYQSDLIPLVKGIGVVQRDQMTEDFRQERDTVMENRKDTKSKMIDKKRDKEEGSGKKRKVSLLKDHFEHLGLEGYNGDGSKYKLKRKKIQCKSRSVTALRI